MTITDKERAEVYEEIERWAMAMQRPLLILRSAVSVARAGIDLPAGRTVEDELEKVMEVILSMPVGLLLSRPPVATVAMLPVDDPGGAA